ncbi:MAG TPA: metalloregulator ArsR/SmtB family transcription factor [Streptosporangiaceae bacterium]
MTGDSDLSVIGALLAEPARALMLLALNGGRELPASTLAGEAGVAPSTASEHLRRLTEGGLIAVTTRGRFRYYRLAGPQVADLIEAVAQLAPARPIASLREGTKANALRRARRCYDHIGGLLGVCVAAAFLRNGYLTGHDGSVDLDRMSGDRPAGGVLDPIAYTLTDQGAQALADLGAEPPRNRAIRCCVDWTEQRHHLAGPAGRELLRTFSEQNWIQPSRHHRALIVTDLGREELVARLGIGPAELDRPRAA